MKKLILIFIIIISFLFKASSQVIDLSGIGIIKDSIGNCIGTGFLFEKPNVILTCNHVDLDHPGNKYFCPMDSSTKFELVVIKRMSELDLILLKSKVDLRITPYKTDTSFKIKPNDIVSYHGYNSTIGIKGKNMISNHNTRVQVVGTFESINLKTSFIEFKGHGIPGYSGGPIFNLSGKLVGICAAGYARQLLKDETMKDTINSGYDIKPAFDWINRIE